jgi:hypothetical protein
MSPRRTHPRFAPLGMSVNAAACVRADIQSGRVFVDPVETLADAPDPVQTLRKGSRTDRSGVVRGNAVDSQKWPICGAFGRNRVY